MEAKRGPASGEKAGNANVLPTANNDESSSSTKKSARGTFSAPKTESTSPAFFEQSEHDKGLETKAKPARVFGVELEAQKESHETEPAKTHEQQETDTTAEIQEHLTSDQELQVVEEYAQDRLDTVQDELATAEKNSADAFIARADKILLEHIAHAARERSAESSTDALLDEASEKAEATLGMSHEDETHEMTEHERNELIDAILHGGDETSGTFITTPEDIDDESIATPTVTPVSAVILAGGGASGTPPGPETPATGDGDDDPDMHRHPASSAHVSTASSGGLPGVSAPRPATEIQSPQPGERAQRRHDFNNGLLIGGVLGYVVGRHHGRKKAERTFKPEQAHLKREVDELQQKIVAREQHIRKLAAAKIIEQQTETHAKLEAHKSEFGRATLTSTETPATPNPVLAAELVGAAATVIGHKPAAEVVAPVTTSEVSPQTSVQERQPISSVETPVETPRLTAKVVKEMPQKELEAVADTIPVKGESLRKIYARGDIGKDALRRIIVEYAQTGRVERPLQREIVEQQRVQRSPELRRESTPRTAQLDQVASDDPFVAPRTPNAAQSDSTEPTSRAPQQTAPLPELSEHDHLNGKIVVTVATLTAVAVVLYAFLR